MVWKIPYTGIIIVSNSDSRIGKCIISGLFLLDTCIQCPRIMLHACCLLFPEPWAVIVQAQISTVNVLITWQLVISVLCLQVYTSTAIGSRMVTQ